MWYSQTLSCRPWVKRQIDRDRFCYTKNGGRLCRFNHLWQSVLNMLWSVFFSANLWYIESIKPSSIVQISYLGGRSEPDPNLWFNLSIVSFWVYPKLKIKAVRIVTSCPRTKIAMYVSNRNRVIGSFYQDLRDLFADLRAVIFTLRKQYVALSTFYVLLLSL